MSLENLSEYLQVPYRVKNVFYFTRRFEKKYFHSLNLVFVSDIDALVERNFLKNVIDVDHIQMYLAKGFADFFLVILCK